jgi:hypothetical protein
MMHDMVQASKEKRSEHGPFRLLSGGQRRLDNLIVQNLSCRTARIRLLSLSTIWSRMYTHFATTGTLWREDSPASHFAIAFWCSTCFASFLKRRTKSTPFDSIDQWRMIAQRNRYWFNAMPRRRESSKPHLPQMVPSYISSLCGTGWVATL